MTMQDKLKIHREIEISNHERLLDYLVELFYDKMTIDEIKKKLEEKDGRMEWDDEFGFLSDLLQSKMYRSELAC